MNNRAETQIVCTHKHHGIRTHLDWEYHRLAHEADRTIVQLTAAYARAAAFYAHLLSDPQLLALWDMTAYVTIEKMGYNDHGQMHAQVVAANALQLLHLFHRAGMEPDIVASGAGTLEEASLVILTAALLHDIGNQISRENHEIYSVILAQPLLTRLLPSPGDDPVQRQLLTSFILSAIASHDCAPVPLTLEGAIVAIADAADMTRGRGRVAFDQGKADIHAISAMAVDQVRIGPGEEKPVAIEVTMENPAGLFQVEKLLGHRLMATGLEQYVSVRACVTSRGSDARDNLPRLVLHQGRFVPEVAPNSDERRRFVDPVCGMVLSPADASASMVFEEHTHYFCSDACAATFRSDPKKYTTGKLG